MYYMLAMRKIDGGFRNSGIVCGEYTAQMA